mmetsp:Transcript_121323/g.343332  ORF Transcript_121323/g.343332 Transcript_121323/m.343332 type:complete len:238 (+) Transcript_121323:65-778(+)
MQTLPRRLRRSNTISDLQRGGVPTLGTEAGRDVVEPLRVHTEIGVADARRAAKADPVIFNRHLKVVHERFPAVEELGKIADAGQELQSSVAFVVQLVHRVGPAPEVDAVLAVLGVSLEHCFEGRDCLRTAHALGPNPQGDLVLAGAGRRGETIVCALLAWLQGLHRRVCQQSARCRGQAQHVPSARERHAAVPRRREGWESAAAETKPDDTRRCGGDGSAEECGTAPRRGHNVRGTP